MNVELMKDAILLTDGSYSIAFIILSKKMWVWEQWMKFGRYGWTLIPSEV